MNYALRLGYKYDDPEMPEEVNKTLKNKSNNLT